MMLPARRSLPVLAWLAMTLAITSVSAADRARAGATNATTFTGQVIRILDGDTAEVLDGKRPVRVRLHQIDAPEKRQPFGTRARQSLADIAFGKQVTVATAGTDRYGRTIGTIYVGTTNANAEQIRRGMAWAEPRYAKDPSLFALEAEARRARRGLWVDASPTPPWEFRRTSAAKRRASD